MFTEMSMRNISATADFLNFVKKGMLNKSKSIFCIRNGF